MDKIFHDKLYNHSVPVAEDLWDRFEQKAFPDKPKRRKVIYWIIPLFLILGLSGYGLKNIMLTNGEQIDQQDEQEKIQNENAAHTVLNTLDIINDNQKMEAVQDIIASVPENTLRKTQKNIKSFHSAQLNNESSKILQVLNKTEKEEGITPKYYDTQILEKFHALAPANSESSSSTELAIPAQLDLFYPVLLESLIPVFTLPKRAACPKFSPLPPKIYFESYLSPDISHKYLESRSTEIMDKYKNERLDSEQGLISFSGGLRASWISGLGYGVKSGLEFAQINERFDYTDPNTNISKTFITIDTIFHPNGTFEVYTDTSTIKIKGETLYSIYNRFTSLNLPILLTYEWTFEQFSIGVTAGVEMNLLFSQKGQMLDENLYAQEFTTGIEDNYRPFKDNLSLSYVTNIGLYVPISKNLEAIIEPHFKLSGSSITRNNYPLTQKFATGGLRFGLRYFIGKKN